MSFSAPWSSVSSSNTVSKTFMELSGVSEVSVRSIQNTGSKSTQPVSRASSTREALGSALADMCRLILKKLLTD